MDPFEFRRRRVNVQAILAFVIAIVVAYLIQQTLGFRGGNLFTALIVVAIGGLYYHLRRIV
jgi:hypothetical protein